MHTLIFVVVQERQLPAEGIKEFVDHQFTQANMASMNLDQEAQVRHICNETPKSTIMNYRPSPAKVDPMMITPSVSSRTSTPLTCYDMSDDEDDDFDDDVLMGEHIIASWNDEKGLDGEGEVDADDDSLDSPSVSTTPPSSLTPENPGSTCLSPPPLLPILHGDGDAETDQKPASSYQGPHQRSDRLHLPPLPVAAQQDSHSQVRHTAQRSAGVANTLSTTPLRGHEVPSTFLTASLMPSPSTLRLLQPRTVSWDSADGVEADFNNGGFIIDGRSSPSSPRTLSPQHFSAALPPTSPYSSSPSRLSPMSHYPRRSQHPQPTRTILQPILPRRNEIGDRTSSLFFVPISADSTRSMSNS